MSMYKTSDVAAIIGIHPNTVRLYEKLELVPKTERLQNGLRKKITKMLKASANRDFETAILRLLTQLSQDPDTDIRMTLNTPEQSRDIIYVCDRLNLSLSAA